MTESEAIEELKHSIVSYEAQNKNNITCDLTREVLNMAINALEKQVPKKSKTDDRYIMYICPCCNDFIKVNHNYCTNCGQRLDWESD